MVQWIPCGMTIFGPVHSDHSLCVDTAVYTGLHYSVPQFNLGCDFPQSWPFTSWYSECLVWPFLAQSKWSQFVCGYCCTTYLSWFCILLLSTIISLNNHMNCIYSQGHEFFDWHIQMPVEHICNVICSVEAEGNVWSKQLYSLCIVQLWWEDTSVFCQLVDPQHKSNSSPESCQICVICKLCSSLIVYIGLG